MQWTLLLAKAFGIWGIIIAHSLEGFCSDHNLLPRYQLVRGGH